MGGRAYPYTKKYDDGTRALMKLSKYTPFSLAAMFFVFAIWASFGFSYSDGVPLALNTISKILNFVVAITLFVRSDKAGSAI